MSHEDLQLALARQEPRAELRAYVSAASKGVVRSIALATAAYGAIERKFDEERARACVT